MSTRAHVALRPPSACALLCCRSVVSAHGVEVLMQSLAMGSADDDREFVAAHAATVLINLSTEEPFKTAVVRGNVVKESLKPLVSGCVFLTIHTLTYEYSLRLA